MDLNMRSWLFLELTACDEHLLTILRFGTAFMETESEGHRVARH